MKINRRSKINRNLSDKVWKFVFRKTTIEPRVVEDIRSSPQGSGSPGTPTSVADRGARRHMEARRLEQERRRKEAVSKTSRYLDSFRNISNKMFFVNSVRRWPVKSTWICNRIWWPRSRNRCREPQQIVTHLYRSSY